MKDNKNDQLNRGRTGDRPNQKPQEIAAKKETNTNGQSEKKGKQGTAAQEEPKELDEETTSEETMEEEETGKPTGKKKSK